MQMVIYEIIFRMAIISSFQKYKLVLYWKMQTDLGHTAQKWLNITELCKYLVR